MSVYGRTIPRHLSESQQKTIIAHIRGSQFEVAADLPKANVKKSGRYFSIVWTVPVIAAIIAAYLVYGHLQQSGPKITISFKDGSGLRTGQTPIKYRAACRSAK